MRALVVTSNPATAAAEPDTPAAALSDLGCEVLAVGYDVDQLPEDIELQRPSVVVVDAGAHLEVGRAAIRRVREVGSLADVPVLLCVEVSRLADAVTIELFGDFFGTRILGALLRLLLGDDVVAQRNALVADEHARA